MTIHSDLSQGKRTQLSMLISCMQHIQSPDTPELSMDGTCGGSDEECVEGRMINDMLVIKQDVVGGHYSATWPCETRMIAVEGNQWVR